MSSALDVEVRPYTRVEFQCKACGAAYRVDSEFSAGPIVGRGDRYQHCTADDSRQLAGPIVAVWEKQKGAWVLVANRQTVPHWKR
jgi:hypothetical protein